MNRARATFWMLVVVAAAAMGGLSEALAAPPSPAAGLGVAVSAIALVLSVALGARILVRLDPAPRDGPPRR